jgi:hypothetical protein
MLLGKKETDDEHRDKERERVRGREGGGGIEVDMWNL